MVPTLTAQAAYPQATLQTLWFKLDAKKDAISLEASIVKIAVVGKSSQETGALAGSPPREETAGAQRSGNVYCRIVDCRPLIKALRERIDGAIDSLAYYPLWALALASAAVINTMFASVRARSWEIGILRSLGLTRSQILRQVIESWRRAEP